ncbi:hypothetical protein [Cyanobium sp. A2C-AMD]|uniref:hypothetical protein n=1 Tax=Cyanobium sp. A2C-AMD TaxID=2823695 RepID=UPI0020CDDA70|nr:hypothetical protein [Cyanobium sp. A2C-AMD]
MAERRLVFKKNAPILAAPETNLFLFAFLLNFVYEVWQSPFYEFYASPSLGDKIIDLTHCAFGDAVIILFSSWVVSALMRSRYWLLTPTWKLTFLFTSIGLLITLAIETYRVNVSKAYGVPVLAVPILGMSALAVIQWIVLPAIILYLARRHMLGYSGQGLQ